eukprot:COSAG04_NODE_1581_length_6253_cov_23.444899_1_plen_278_part_10
MPGSRGFDYYLGIPYSDDMGAGRFTPCGGGKPQRVVNKPDGLAYLPEVTTAHDPLCSARQARAKLWGYLQDQKTLGTPIEELNYDVFDAVSNHLQPFLSRAAASFLNSRVSAQTKGDPAATLLPLVHQEPGADGKPKTTILEQPLDFTTLADKYNDYVTVSSRTTHSHFSSEFLSDILRRVPELSSVDVGRASVHAGVHRCAPRLSVLPLHAFLSRAHHRRKHAPEAVYKPRLFFLSAGNPVSRMVVVCWCVGADANCQHQNGTRRGRFGDALLEVDC